MTAEEIYRAPRIGHAQARLIDRALLREAIRDAGPQLRIAWLTKHPPSAFYWAACDRMWARIAKDLP